MICDFDRIDALLSGELTGEERASVLAHTESCPTCRAYYEAMAGLEGEEAAPAGFTARVMETVRATPQTKVRRHSRWQGLAAMAACAVLVVGLGLGSGMMGRAESAPADADELMRNANDPGTSPMPETVYGKAAQGDDMQAYDMPLPVHTLTDEALCAQVRGWMIEHEIPQLYPDGPREAYDLTAQQVQELNGDIPLLALPEEFLQLELKSAE